MEKISVGILGATGLVGQRLVQFLSNHPWFRITELVASNASVGKIYHEVCQWRVDNDMPEKVKRMRLKEVHADLNAQVLFSALPAKTACRAEERYAQKNYVIVSNSSSFRMEKDVPLLIPEVNPDHLQLVHKQKIHRNYENGFIVTNPNCVSIPLSLVLAPLHKSLGVEKVLVTTLQALSGAGGTGVASLDIFDNVIPFIKEEEDKIEAETKKILGDYQNDEIIECKTVISAQVNRVPVVDGHLASVSVKLSDKAKLSEIKITLSRFAALPQALNLPSAPSRPIIVRKEADRPQPRLDRNAANGMAVSVGRIRKCSVLDFKFTILSHNTIRGAAGAAVLNAELLKAQGYI